MKNNFTSTSSQKTSSREDLYDFYDLELSPEEEQKKEIFLERIDFFEKESQEFENLLERLEQSQNHSITNALKMEKLFLKARDRAFDMKHLRTSLETLKKHISRYPALYFLLEKIELIEGSFENPRTRVQRLGTMKEVKKALAPREKAMSNIPKTKRGSAYYPRNG